MQRILLAEDDIVARTILVDQIRGMGYEVVACADGRQALDVLMEEGGIDLLLTDIRMPEMGGEELIQQLRGMPVFENLPVVIMSGVVGIKEISSLLKQGASRFLAKPIDKEELEEALAQALSVPHS